jgi:hypothetical protein
MRGYASTANLSLDLPVFSANNPNIIKLAGAESSKVKHLCAIAAETSGINEITIQMDQVWDAWTMILNCSLDLAPNHSPIGAPIWTFVCGGSLILERVIQHGGPTAFYFSLLLLGPLASYVPTIS